MKVAALAAAVLATLIGGVVMAWLKWVSEATRENREKIVRAETKLDERTTGPITTVEVQGGTPGQKENTQQRKAPSR